MPQHGTYWCIPASIENMLRCVGCHALSQEDLVEAFIRAHVGGGFAQAARHIVLENFRCAPLPGAFFGSFKTVAERLLGTNLRDRTIVHLNGLARDEYLRETKSRISTDEPVLISARSGPATCHITVVFAYEGDVLSTCDPALGRAIALDAAQIQFEPDLLTFERT
ncbi:MAG: hypothetical protein U0167_14285 [bacterium]